MGKVYNGLPKQILTISKNTQKYTLQDIYAELDECKKMLHAIGYGEVMKNNYTITYTKAKKVYGQCQDLGHGRYNIKINKEFMQLAKPEDFHEMIIHELLHSIDGGMKHTGRWKQAADRVNRLYVYPTPVSRLGHSKEYREGYLNDQYNHKITCNECGHSWKWIRKSPIINSCIKGTAACPCGSHSFTYEYIGGK